MTTSLNFAGRTDAIVIGASAGGVDALMTLLPALPAHAAVPVIVVLHLPRHHPSSLAEIFRSRCALEVREVEDKDPIRPGVVYFAPPDYHLLVDKGPAFALSTDEPVNYSRPSIDVLFESAADLYGERLGGIILTGANSDGAAGLQAVRRAGGFTIVQEPSTAHSSAMPAAAMARVDVDFNAPLSAIAGLLRTLPTSLSRHLR
jgi:two-component system, chemotaxis family, protein-glutamate methylesterase/glutaminase